MQNTNFYRYSKRIAYQIKTGTSPDRAATFNHAVCKNYTLQEIAHLVDVAYFLHLQDGKHINQHINALIAKEAKIPRHIKKTDTNKIQIADKDDKRKITQLYHLYRVVGKTIFIKMYCPSNISKYTFEKWCNKVFINPDERNKKGIRVHPHKKEVLDFLKRGAYIDFSETTTSVYIVLNDEKIRISNHENYNDENNLYKKVILNIIIR